MRLTSRVAERFGRRDWVENAAVKVYNALVLERNRKVGTGELLLLIPRCLSRATLDGVLQIAGKYDVPVFVATRGQLARRVIRERRPRAVVAVACERDMVSGLHDVAEHFLPDLLAELLAHHFHRHFTGAEALQAHGAAHALQPLVYGFLDALGRNLHFHPALQGAGRFN